MARAYTKNFALPEMINNVYDEDEEFLYVSMAEGVGPVASNSSTANLGAGAVFTGTAFDTTGFAIVYVSVFSDKASATDGLSIQQSKDGTNWKWTDEYTVPANSGKTYSIQPALQWMRIVYTNGADAQTSFLLSTNVKQTMALDSSHRIQDPIVDEDDARLRKSVITAKKDSGAFTNVGATNSGNLRVTEAESGLAIAKGDVTGTSFVHKFGNAPDYDTTDNEVVIWDGANDADQAVMGYTYSTTADIDRISSSDNSDTQDIEIQGLDSNYDLVTQTITLTGQTPASLTTSLIRVFRMKNVGSTATAGYVYCFVNVATTGGVPNTAANIRAVLDDGNNQTEMAIYTIPNGKTGYMRSFFASTAGASKDSNYIIRLYARPTGQVFQLKHRTALSDNGTSYIQHKYIEPEVFAAKTDIEMTTQMTASGASAASTSGGFDIVLVDD